MHIPLLIGSLTLFVLAGVVSLLRRRAVTTSPLSATLFLSKLNNARPQKMTVLRRTTKGKRGVQTVYDLSFEGSKNVVFTTTLEAQDLGPTRVTRANSRTTLLNLVRLAKITQDNAPKSVENPARRA